MEHIFKIIFLNGFFNHNMPYFKEYSSFLISIKSLRKMGDNQRNLFCHEHCYKMLNFNWLYINIFDLFSYPKNIMAC